MDKKAFGRSIGGTTFLGTDGPAKMSPDGEKIVVWEPKVEPSEINNWRYIGDVIMKTFSGAGTTTVLVPDTDITSLFWSKDGQKVIYIGSGGLQTVNANTKKTQKLISGSYIDKDEFSY